MRLSHVTWKGPAVDDPEMLTMLPDDLSRLLRQINGFIQFHGGLHVRGASTAPSWHSVRNAWLGKEAFHRSYPKMKSTDVPFAEDFLGNQFLLREGQVIFMDGETGDVELRKQTLAQFFAAIESDPISELDLNILMDFQATGGKLKPGELLAVVPPLCTEQAADGISVAPVSAAERRSFLSQLAGYLRSMPDGGSFDLRVRE